MLISKLPGIVSRARLLNGRKPLAGPRSDFFAAWLVTLGSTEAAFSAAM